VTVAGHPAAVPPAGVGHRPPAGRHRKARRVFAGQGAGEGDCPYGGTAAPCRAAER